MSELIQDKVVCFTENQLREGFKSFGLNSELTERAIIDYKNYRESEISNYSLLSHKDLLAIDKYEKIKESGEKIVEDILRKYLRYLNYKKQIAEIYQESKDWLKVYSTVYSDIQESQEGFIDYIEETYQTKIKDAKHLQELTGITQLNSWDKKTGNYITPDTEEEAKDNAIRDLNKTLINSKYSKYFRALEKNLQEGAKYKNLLEIKPQDYGLPKTWSGCLSSDQYSSILWAIIIFFLIDEVETLRPDLKTIAQEIQAPYSLLMDAHKICKEWKL